MLTPDLDLARAFLEHRPPPGRVLLCGVTGAHLYGFPSPDSDFDLKGIHLAPTTSLLGFQPRTPAHDHTEIYRGVECDLTTNEAADALGLLVAGNGNMLERILSPLQVVVSDEAAELQSLAQGAISAQFARHYSGFLKGRRRELQHAPTVKGLLYGYRVAFTGIHLLQTGMLDPHLPTLVAERPERAAVMDLVEIKFSGAEHASADAALLDFHVPALERLADELSQAETHSKLPPTAPNVNEVEHWLIARRTAELR